MTSVKPDGPYKTLRLNSRTDSWAVVTSRSGQIVTCEERLLLALSLDDATRIAEVLNNGAQPSFDICSLIRRAKPRDPL
jgi:hypothetical protein